MLGVVAHHDDYSKPLDVRWLCRSHHMQLHADLRKLGTPIQATPEAKSAAHRAVAQPSAYKQLNCWVSDELAAEVEAAATHEDRSVSSWLRRLILAALENSEKEEVPVS